MKKLTSLALASIFLTIIAGGACAVPRLQTYIVGSTYHNFYRQEFNSWITNSSNFDVRVIGYWQPAGDGGNPSLLGCPQSGGGYDYMDTYLMVSTPIGQSGTVWINGVEMSFGNYWSNLPAGVDPNASLRFHFPAAFGRFSFTPIGPIDNDQVNAHEYSHNGIGNPGWGDEILLRDIVVSGYSWVHFDAVGVDSYGRTFTNPYSSDASYYGSCATPEPGTLSLLGLGLLGMIPILRRKRG